MRKLKRRKLGINRDQERELNLALKRIIDFGKPEPEPPPQPEPMIIDRGIRTVDEVRVPPPSTIADIWSRYTFTTASTSDIRLTDLDTTSRAIWTRTTTVPLPPSDVQFLEAFDDGEALASDG